MGSLPGREGSIESCRKSQAVFKRPVTWLGTWLDVEFSKLDQLDDTDTIHVTKLKATFSSGLFFEFT